MQTVELCLTPPGISVFEIATFMDSFQECNLKPGRVQSDIL